MKDNWGINENDVNNFGRLLSSLPLILVPTIHVGQSFNIRIPDNEIWLLHSLFTVAIYDANIGNRRVLLQILDSQSNILFEIAPQNSAAPGSTVRYSFIRDHVNHTAQTSVMNIKLPITALKGGWQLSLSIDGVQVGDALGKTVLTYSNLLLG